MITISAEISKEKLAEVISSNWDDALDIIKQIDTEMADWDFTEQMFNYFKEEMEKKGRGV